MKLYQVYVLIVSCALSACVSAPKSLEYYGQSQDALVIVTTKVYGSGTEYFRGIDLENMDFKQNEETVKIDTYEGIETLLGGRLTQLNRGDKDRIIVIAYSKFPVGDYVHVEGRRATGNSFSGAVTSMCGGEKAPVYKFRQGEIAIIRTDGYRKLTDKRTLEIFAEARRDYPGIIGEAKIRKPDLFVTYNGDRSGAFAMRMCKERGKPKPYVDTGVADP